jgi:predicted RNA-binding protein with PUA-like domain
MQKVYHVVFVYCGYNRWYTFLYYTKFTMKYWLMKSEEGEYSIDDLKRDKKAPWFGVRNYLARNYMRDHMEIGDTVLFYHSNGKPSGVVGICKVASLPYPDSTQFDKTSPYHYPRATQEKPVWMLVDVSFVKKYKKMLSINEMRMINELDTMILLQKGSRLSVTPVAKKEFIFIDALLTK